MFPELLTVNRKTIVMVDYTITPQLLLSRINYDGLVKSLLLRHSPLRGNDGKLAECSFYDAINYERC
jgi:hypothetical protein